MPLLYSWFRERRGYLAGANPTGVADRGQEIPLPTRPPLVVGLVGAAGTDLREVVTELRRSFARFHYETVEVGLSDRLFEFGMDGRRLLNRPIRRSPYDARIADLQSAGNRLRQRVDRGDAMVMLALARILKDKGGLPNRAYVIRSLKTRAEVEALRQVFGYAFILVAAYAPHAWRREHLEQSIAESEGLIPYTPGGKFRARAEAVIDRDAAEPGIGHGQEVRKTFPLADLFVDVSNPPVMKQQTGRIVDILFGAPFVTPTRDEQAMFFAQTARLRSASIHRQVGAALVTRDGELLSVGCNDVPKFRGGLYWDGDEPDSRDFVLDKDVSLEKKVETLSELLRKLGELRMLDRGTVRRIARRGEAFVKEILERLEGTRLADLIEFYRTTHAEMEAILSAGRRGVSTKDAWLFSTTFPCHECTRHIITAGVSRVVYVEPYEKSLGPFLHEDAVSVDDPKEKRRLQMVPFVGVGPRVYHKVFEARERRRKGEVMKLDPRLAIPIFPIDNDLVLPKLISLVAAFADDLVTTKLIEKKAAGTFSSLPTGYIKDSARTSKEAKK